MKIQEKKSKGKEVVNEKHSYVLRPKHTVSYKRNATESGKKVADLAPMTPEKKLDNKKEKKNKGKEVASISIDRIEGKHPYSLRPMLKVSYKPKPAKSGKEVTASLPRTPKKKLDKKKPKAFRPKVLFDSPFTPPRQATSSKSKNKKPSCKKALNFEPSGDIKEKSIIVYTRRGFCFPKTVSKYLESDQQKSLTQKEKDERAWMQIEKDLFQERAKCFIKSISRLQGKRSFMGWRGSVVDSVVGAFLAQNTSDNYSSSTFMSLAAKYPNLKTIRDPEHENHTVDSVDWNAVRCEEVEVISSVIQDRGNSERIADRIQAFLNGAYNDKSGLLDLEWLRKADSEEAIKYIMKIHGLGVKSTSCIRLLTLRQEAFPVDTHVSRIVVRLGWVPIKKLPDEILFHQLEEYPEIKEVQKYLSPRISGLDADLLYELHCQMITFGKVFCQKQKPNCSACPLKRDCKHYASQFPSISSQPIENTMAPVTPGRTKDAILRFKNTPYQEPEDIEDLCIPKVHPAILETEELVTSVWKYMGENGIPLEGSSVSKAISDVSAEASSSWVNKVKSAGRLRTEHQVYELPDDHPLVEELDTRDPDDQHRYLLAIWPQDKCSSSKSCELIHTNLLEEEKVLGTFLIPCRTATRGSFPLDGTFFQINEVFADYESSEEPLPVATGLLSDLPRKTLYCGTSISSILKRTSDQKIQDCFLEGYVCIRGFNPKTREPSDLHQKFHRTLSRNINVNAKRKSPSKQIKNDRTVN